jgi:hypothetical protein
MSKARNKKTEAVRLSLPVVDLINYLARYRMDRHKAIRVRFLMKTIILVGTGMIVVVIGRVIGCC